MTKKQLVEMLNAFSDNEAVRLVVPVISMPEKLDGKDEYSWAIYEVVKHEDGCIEIVAC